MIKTRV